MKYNKFAAALLLLLGTTSSFASGSFHVASGTINNSNKVSNIALTVIQNQPNWFDVTCSVTATNIENSPATFQPMLVLPASNTPSIPYFMYYDGKNISPNGNVSAALVINDTKTHTIKVAIYGSSVSSETQFSFTWRNGDVSSAINYTCSAEQQIAHVKK